MRKGVTVCSMRKGVTVCSVHKGTGSNGACMYVDLCLGMWLCCWWSLSCRLGKTGRTVAGWAGSQLGMVVKTGNRNTFVGSDGGIDPQTKLSCRPCDAVVK